MHLERSYKKLINYYLRLKTNSPISKVIALISVGRHIHSDILALKTENWCGIINIVDDLLIQSFDCALLCF